MFTKVIAVVIASLSLMVCQTAQAATSRVNNIGINVGNPALDYCPDKIFADAMRSHRFWERMPNVPQGVEAPLDSNYWPASGDVNGLIWQGLNTKNNHGTYKLSFTGNADATAWPGGVDGVISNKVYNAATNTTTADLVITNTDNEILWIRFTNTTGGLRNIKLMRPLTPGSTQSYPTDRVFTDQYLSQLAPFKCIRYVDWGVIQASGDSLWSDRTKWTDARQSPPIPAGEVYPTGRGASWESLIMLANTSGKDAWICIPHMATDDYIRQLAILFRDGNQYTAPLRADLKLYVEYSNEIWNWGWPFGTQTTWAHNQAKAYGYPLNFDGEPDNGGFTRYKAMRTVQISTIFRSVFGDAQMMTHVRPVLCWQKGWLDVANKAITFIDLFYNKRDSRSNWGDPHPVNYYLYGGSSTGYWYTETAVGLTTDNIWTNGTWDAAKFYTLCADEAALTKTYGLTYLAYEGDNHPAYNGDEAIVKQIHWDPRMKQATLDHLNVWNRLDGDLFNFLVLNNYGLTDWGIRNTVDPANSPQLEAIEQFNATAPLPVDLGTLIPFSRSGRSWDTWGSTGRTATPGDTGAIGLVPDGLGFTASYLFRTLRDTMCNVRVEYNAAAGAALDVEYNGTVIGTYTKPAGVTGMSFTPNVQIACKGDKVHCIRMVARLGNVSIRTIAMVGTAPWTTGIDGNVALLSTKPGFSIRQLKNTSTLVINTGFKDAYDVVVTNALGKSIIIKKQMRGTMGLDISDLSAGVYFVALNRGGKNVSMKFVR